MNVRRNLAPNVGFHVKKLQGSNLSALRKSSFSLEGGEIFSCDVGHIDRFEIVPAMQICHHLHRTLSQQEIECPDTGWHNQGDRRLELDTNISLGPHLHLQHDHGLRG